MKIMIAFLSLLVAYCTTPVFLAGAFSPKPQLAFSSVILAPQRHLVTIDDLATLQDVDWVDLSADGLHLAYTVNRPYTVSEIWVADAHPNARPRFLAKGAVPRWSPDGKRIAFFAENEGKTQIWVADPGTGVARALTKFSAGIQLFSDIALIGLPIMGKRTFSWSPDSQAIALSVPLPRTSDRAPNVATGSDPNLAKSPLVFTRDSPIGAGSVNVFKANESWRVRRDRGDAHLFLINVTSGLTEQLTTNGTQYFDPSWSPDGASIVFISAESRPLLRLGPPATNVYELDLRSRLQKRLTTGDGIKVLPQISPDGKFVAYGEAADYTALGQIQVVKRDGGNPAMMTKRVNRSIRWFTWDAMRLDSLLVRVRDGVQEQVLRGSVTNALFSKVEGTSDSPQITSQAKDGTLAWSQDDPIHHGLIRVLRPNAQTPADLFNVNPQIASWTLGAQEIVKWRNSRGEQIEGVLIKPVGYRSDQSYPTVVDTYPGRLNDFKGDLIRANQVLAARGYAVLFTNSRAPHVAEIYTKDAAFGDAARGEQGADIAFDDTMSGVEYLVKRGIADPSKLVLFGHSNASSTAGYVLTRTDRFKAAFLSGDFSDWALTFFLAPEVEYIPFVFGGEPWKNSGAYVKFSLLYHADRITTPLMLAVGDKDTMSLINSIELFNVLHLLRRDVTLVRYPDAGHAIALESPRHGNDFWNRVFMFFDEAVGLDRTLPKHKHPQKP
jgi:dipeptidyl aminopeptidase/acylaminoacyl peptidase